MYAEVVRLGHCYNDISGEGSTMYNYLGTIDFGYYYGVGDIMTR